MEQALDIVGAAFQLLQEQDQYKDMPPEQRTAVDSILSSLQQLLATAPAQEVLCNKLYVFRFTKNITKHLQGSAKVHFHGCVNSPRGQRLLGGGITQPRNRIFAEPCICPTILRHPRPSIPKSSPPRTCHPKSRAESAASSTRRSTSCNGTPSTRQTSFF